MTEATDRLIAIAPGEALFEPIAPDRVTEGAPTAATINTYELGDHTFVGEWAATPGAWRVSYDEWEFCHVLAGRCELVPDGGAPRAFGPGDSLVIEPGFTGVWRVIEPMRKRYVVRL
jgi:uncharacterized cupin superfamily protein